MSGLRGVGAATADYRFSDKERKLLKSMKFPEDFNLKPDLSNVKWEVIKKWVAGRATELLGLEDEVVIGYIIEQIDGKKTVDPKLLQISLTGFLEKNTSLFVKELWELLLSASKTASGIPQPILDKEAEKARARKEENDAAEERLRKEREKLRKEREEEREREDRHREERRKAEREERERRRERELREREKERAREKEREKERERERDRRERERERRESERKRQREKERREDLLDREGSRERGGDGDSKRVKVEVGVDDASLPGPPPVSLPMPPPLSLPMPPPLKVETDGGISPRNGVANGEKGEGGTNPEGATEGVRDLKIDSGGKEKKAKKEKKEKKGKKEKKDKKEKKEKKVSKGKGSPEGSDSSGGESEGEGKPDKAKALEEELRKSALRKLKVPAAQEED